MRPVERGPVPMLPNGKVKVVKQYQDWRADLIVRLGPYCSYCNIKLNDSPQVEHVAPKTPVPALRLDWDNMLLACGACNSVKNDALCSSVTHFLPDYHNTHLAFTNTFRLHKKMPGSMAGAVVPRLGLTMAQQAKALSTIALCGLARVEQDAKRRRRASDLRWQYRAEASAYANRYRTEWDTLPASFVPQFLGYLGDVVREKGFFTVWFDAFHDVPQVKSMLVGVFPNTAACFPAPDYNPVERIAGDL